jgi:methyltransferase
MGLYLILGFVVLQRLAELAYARRNTARLLARGGIETGAGHYPLFVLLHGGWLIALIVFVPSETEINVGLLLIFATLQAARVWVLVSLGRQWTTRIITIPDEPLVARGPYRFLRHPNYVVVAGEIAVLPLIFGAWKIAIIFSLLNVLLLRHRVGIENGVLATRNATN